MRQVRFTAIVAAFIWILAGHAAYSATLKVQWDPPVDNVTVGYVVWWGTSAGVYTQHIDVGMITTYDVTGLGDATTYYLAVQAYDAVGDISPLSAEVSATTPTPTTGGNGLGQSRRKPKPPKNVTTSLDGTSISLAWDAPDEPLSGYRVEVGTRPGRTDVSSFTTGVTTTFTIGELQANRYYIRVRSVNEHGAGEPSTEVMVARAGGVDAPRRLSSEVLADASVRLSWSPPSDAAGVTAYVIEAGTAPTRNDLGTVQATGLSFTTPVLAAGTYFARIRALRNGVAGSASNETAFHIGTEASCQRAPAVPTFAASVVGTLVQLSWSPGAGDAPTGYVLDVGSIPGLRDIATLQFDADTTTFTSPAPNGTYAFRMTAVNACGASQWAHESSITVGGPPPMRPNAPIDLNHSVAGHTVTLTWAPPMSGGDATRYVVEASDTSGNLLVTLDTGNLSTTFVHGNVPPGQYVVRVKAANGAGAGAASNAVTVTVNP